MKVLTEKNKLKKILLVTVISASVLIGVSGCAKQAPQAPPPTLVKTMNVIKQDTPIKYEFVGEVIPREEVSLRAVVSGSIVNKFVDGGAMVTEGQPLFVIDPRPYQATVLDTRAQLAAASASYSNSARDAERYAMLVEQDAISKQMYDTAASVATQAAGQVAAQEARLAQAEVDLGNTVVRAPISGKLDTQDLSVGMFASAGSTVLATLAKLDPVMVQFSISEADYLKFVNAGQINDTKGLAQEVEIYLSDGSKYAYNGRVEQVDRALKQGTGTLTMKAIVQNPNNTLVPGMFARIKTEVGIAQGALLVPQRAIQTILDKNFISVVTSEKKVELRPVVVGNRVGELAIIDSGLKDGDLVIVEGQQKVQAGAQVTTEMVTLEDLSNTKK